MSVIAHGIDLVSVARIGDMVERHGVHFLERIFTPGEIEYAADSRRRNEHLAGRFAVKEAVFKAVGTGQRLGIAWTDAEVVSGSLGRPLLKTSGRLHEISGELGIKTWSVSISHTNEMAVASVIGTT